MSPSVLLGLLFGIQLYLAISLHLEIRGRRQDRAMAEAYLDRLANNMVAALGIDKASELLALTSNQTGILLVEIKRKQVDKA